MCLALHRLPQTWVDLPTARRPQTAERADDCAFARWARNACARLMAPERESPGASARYEERTGSNPEPHCCFNREKARDVNATGHFPGANRAT